MLCSISATGKSSSKWLDRLRSSKGLPPGADVDLEQFLNDSQNSSPPILQRERPTSASDPNCSRNDRTFEAQNPDGDTRLLSMMSNVLAELFVMGGNSNSLPSKKCSRKQPNPKFCAAIDSPGSNTHNNNSGSNDNAHALMKNESASPMSDHNSGVGMAKDRSSDEQLKLVDDAKCGDEEEKEKGCVSLLGFSRTEVTVIDTSFATWKFEKMLFRKKNVWKVRDKNSKTVNLGKKKKRKTSAIDNGNSGGAEEKKQKVLHGQCSLSKKGSGGAINEETSQSNKPDTIGKGSKKNSDKSSSVVLIKNIPTSKKIGMSVSRSCPKSTQRPPKP